MRWLADECVDARLAALLRSQDHDVIHAAEFAPTARDVEIAKLAQREVRLLLTEDKDFGDLVIRRAVPVPGLVLLRVFPDDLSFKWARLRLAIARFDESLFGRHVVVSASRIRSRDLP